MITLNTGKFGTYFKDEINKIELTNEMILGRLNSTALLIKEIQELKAMVIEARPWMSRGKAYGNFSELDQWLKRAENIK